MAALSWQRRFVACRFLFLITLLWHQLHLYARCHSNKRQFRISACAPRPASRFCSLCHNFRLKINLAINYYFQATICCSQELKKAVNIKLSCLKTTVTCPCLLWTTSWQSLGSQETSAQHSGSPRSKIFLWVVLASLTKRKLSDKWCIGRKTHIIKANTQNKVATTRPLPST